MSHYVFMTGILAGTMMQLLVLSVLVRGQYRQFFTLTAYTLILFLVTVSGGAMYADIGRAWSANLYLIYWVGDSLTTLLLFLVIVALILRALKGSPSRARILRLILLATAILIAGSWFFTENVGMNRKMPAVSRNLSFLAALLNLVLWSALIRKPGRERVVMLLSGGIGLQFTGQAIGHSLRLLGPSLVMLGNVVLVFSHLLCLWIWWAALRQNETAQIPAARVQTAD